ncbi:MAG: hypothetical protein H7Y42_18660 [Chitinophagaceae bacterium]|nr:hypothetical protein [Chitinophagaceae bacterium]
MRKTNIIRTLLLALAITGGILVLWAATPGKESHPCNEVMDGTCQKKHGDDGNKMIWESLSHQFFSSASF